jgi:hypothetical protein
MDKSDITKLRTMKDVFEYINDKHPGWIIDMFDGYSDDYPELTDNWMKVCETFKVKPQKIIIIERLELDDHFNFAELLSQTGFVVRTRYEFLPCRCGKILPTHQIYEKLKENNKHTPDEWSNHCIKCAV